MTTAGNAREILTERDLNWCVVLMRTNEPDSPYRISHAARAEANEEEVQKLLRSLHQLLLKKDATGEFNPPLPVRSVRDLMQAYNRKYMVVVDGPVGASGVGVSSYGKDAEDKEYAAALADQIKAVVFEPYNAQLAQTHADFRELSPGQMKVVLDEAEQLGQAVQAGQIGMADLCSRAISLGERARDLRRTVDRTGD